MSTAHVMPPSFLLPSISLMVSHQPNISAIIAKTVNKVVTVTMYVIVMIVGIMDNIIAD